MCGAGKQEPAILSVDIKMTNSLPFTIIHADSVMVRTVRPCIMYGVD